jgi:hydrogenase maturation protease
MTPCGTRTTTEPKRHPGGRRRPALGKANQRGKMGANPPSKVMVLGIGNLIRADDGFGVHAVQRLEGDARVPREVTLLDGGTHGIELLSYVSEATHLLLLDAIDAGQPAGTPIRLANEELRGLPCGGSVHQLGLADLLATLPLVSATPKEIVLLGVQPGTTGWGTELSAPVEAALDGLLDEAVEQLIRWAEEPAEKPAPTGAGSRR